MVFDTNLHSNSEYRFQENIKIRTKPVYKTMIAYIVLIITLIIFSTLMYLILYKIPFNFAYMGFNCVGNGEECYIFVWYAFCLFSIMIALFYSRSKILHKKNK